MFAHKTFYYLVQDSFQNKRLLYTKVIFDILKMSCNLKEKKNTILLNKFSQWYLTGMKKQHCFKLSLQVDKHSWGAKAKNHYCVNYCFVKYL